MMSWSPSYFISFFLITLYKSYSYTLPNELLNNKFSNIFFFFFFCGLLLPFHPLPFFYFLSFLFFLLLLSFFLTFFCSFFFVFLLLLLLLLFFLNYLQNIFLQHYRFTLQLNFPIDNRLCIILSPTVLIQHNTQRSCKTAKNFSLLVSVEHSLQFSAENVRW